MRTKPKIITLEKEMQMLDDFCLLTKKKKKRNIKRRRP